MKLVDILLLFLLIYGVFTTHFSVKRSRSPKERFFAIRTAAFSWMVGFLFLFAFLFLPNKQRVLMMLPAFFVAVTLTKVWRNSRARLRREDQERIDLERMKRVN